ncbi:hypothetical protein, partial [Dickeya dadantii]|uniref:hypothetical protein n=1 Tax=Dickeya dadantii TaxID=204038 RepID=UPI001C12D97B
VVRAMMLQRNNQLYYARNFLPFWHKSVYTKQQVCLFTASSRLAALFYLQMSTTTGDAKCGNNTIFG